MNFDLFSISGLVLCAAFFFAGIVDAVCGGGGLITLPTFMAVGFPVPLITGTNQSSILFGNATAFLRYLKGGHIQWRTALPAVPFTMFGAFLGAKLNLILPERALEIIMIVIAPIVAVVVLTRRSFGEEDHSDTLATGRIVLNSALIGLIIGGYQGFYGAGSGTFFMLAMAVMNRLDLITASGNTKLITFCSSIASAVTFAVSGNVVWGVALAATFFNVAGSYIGSGLAMTKGAKVIRPMFIGVLVLLCVRLITELL